MMMPPRASVLLLLLSAILPAAAQQPATPSPTASPIQAQVFPQNSGQPTPTLTVKAHLVLLDVVVTDKHGQPIKGLKQSDFQLSEDGVPQTLASFAEHDAGSTPPAPPPPKLPPNTFTDHASVTNNGAMTVLLFDELSFSDPHSSGGELVQSFADGAYTRYQVAAFAKTMPPGTVACIFRLDWNGLQLIQDFTTDSHVLEEAVRSKRNSQRFAGVGVRLSDIRASAMRQLARYLSAFPGRKNLIWFSRGIVPQVSIGMPGSPFSDISTFTNDLQGATDTLTLSRIALYPVDTRGLVVDPHKGFDIIIEGSEASELAAATGGKAFYNTNGIKEAVAEVAATGSNYYTLSYSPTNNLWNGAFRKLKIKLSNNVSTYVASQTSPVPLAVPFRLEYRSGYYARDNARWRSRVMSSSPSSDARKLISYSPKGDPEGYGAVKRTPLEEAMSFGAVAPFQILFQAHVTPELRTEKIKRNMPLPQDNFLKAQWQHTPYRNYQIHYSIQPQNIEFASQRVGSYHGNIQFIAIVYDSGGNIVNSLVNTREIQVDAAAYSRIMQSSGLALDETIAVPAKEDFFLRLGVVDLISGRIGALEVPVETIKLQPPENNSTATTQTP
jgi:VWFA-related protein